MPATSLLDQDDSVLIVVDAQPGFLPSGADRVDPGVIERIAWLVRVATAVGVPIVVTEEEPDRNGATDRSISAHLPPATPVLPKPVFGLADVAQILDEVEATARRTAVLVGAETDVCVAHSALGLIDRGYRVAVVADATWSPGAMHEHGLRRITDAGGTVVHAKGVYYEWLRRVDAASEFQRAHPDLARPPGFRL